MRKEIITYTSDLSGEEGAVPTQIRVELTMDLTSEERAELETFLAKYRTRETKPSAIRVVPLMVPTHGTVSVKTGVSAETPADRAVMRGWLRGHGYKIGDKGVISAELRRAFIDKTPHPEWAAAQELAAAPAEIPEALPDVAQAPEDTQAAPEAPQEPEKPRRAAAKKAPAKMTRTEIPPAAKTRRAATTSNVIQLPKVDEVEKPARKRTPRKAAAQ